jgi:DivIVA domain-containing protein
VRERRRVPAELRNVSFPASVRGYDRHAVDVYIARVNRFIAELEATRSPESAVRHALDRAEEQTSSILQSARDTAEQITAVARQEAHEITARAKAEAADIVVNASAQADRAKAEADKHVAKATTEADKILERARKEADEGLQRSRDEIAAIRAKAEAWAREFHTDTEAIQEKRRALLDDVRHIAARLATAATNAAARLPLESADAGEHGGGTAVDVRDESDANTRREAAAGADRSAS